MIVRTPDKDLFPRLRMGRFKSVALGKFGDFFACELRKQMLREIASRASRKPLTPSKCWKSRIKRSRCEWSACR